MADQQKNDEEFFAERGFGLRIGFGEKPAVIVIDVINAFTNPDMMLGANLDNEIEETNQARCRARAGRAGDLHHGDV